MDSIAACTKAKGCSATQLIKSIVNQGKAVAVAFATGNQVFFLVHSELSRRTPCA